jgi:hypothetical protein
MRKMINKLRKDTKMLNKNKQIKELNLRAGDVSLPILK